MDDPDIIEATIITQPPPLDRPLTHSKADQALYAEHYRYESRLSPDDENVQKATDALSLALQASHANVDTGTVLAVLLQDISDCTVADIDQACRDVADSDLGMPQLQYVPFRDGSPVDSTDHDMPDRAIDVGKRIEQHQKRIHSEGFFYVFPRLALESRLCGWTAAQIEAGVEFVDRTRYSYRGTHLRFFSPNEEAVFGPPEGGENLLQAGA